MEKETIQKIKDALKDKSIIAGIALIFVVVALCLTVVKL